MLSRRVPYGAADNALARVLAGRRASGARLLDLTETDPVSAGLADDAGEMLSVLAALGGPGHEPEPRGTRKAREAVADYYRDRGVGADPDDVVLTASTSEAYAHLFRLLCDPGDAAAAPFPGYPLLEPLATLEDVRIRRYRLGFDGAWHLDLDSLERATGPRTRAVVVVQPNNPTGSCHSAEEVAAVEGRCERTGAALISDEVFGDFPRPPATAPLPSLLGSRRVPAFVLGGLSKCCGLPQMKVGWIVVGGPASARREAMRGLEWIADLFLSVSSPAQAALPRWLAGRHGFQSRARERIAANLATVGDLERRCPQVTALPAQGGWMQVLGLPRTRTDEAWALEMLRRDVIVHPGYFYDFAEEGHLVVSLLPEPRVFAEAMARIAEVVEAA